ncbi:MAG: hypothetical protein AABY83_01045 [Pseudomonadota bacterium]
MNSILTVAAVSAIVLGAAFMAWFPSPGHLVSVGKEFAFPPKLLDAHLYTIERHGDAVSMVSDGTLGRVLEPDGKYWQSSFAVGAQQEFFALPGPDTQTRFRLDRISADGVDINYVTRQRPRKGGEIGALVDHGVLHMTWRHNQSRFNLPPRQPEK